MDKPELAMRSSGMDNHPTKRAATAHGLIRPTTATKTATILNHDRDSVLKQLRRQVGCISTAPGNDAAIMSTGSALIDGFLPRGGLRADAINEWMGASDSSGASLLAMIAASTYLNSRESDGTQSYANRLNTSGPLVVVDKEELFYPPAAVALGISTKRIILVRPKNHADHVWAIDQALRCKSVAAVWSPIGPQLNDRDARRFQLAAETGRTPGFLIRPASVRGRPTFADARLYSEHKGVRPLFWEHKGVRPLFCEAPKEPICGTRGPNPVCNSLQLQITIDRCRGGTMGQKIQLQIDELGRLQPIESPVFSRQPDHHETATMHLAARLAYPAVAQSDADSHRRRA